MVNVFDSLIVSVTSNSYKGDSLNFKSHLIEKLFIRQNETFDTSYFCNVAIDTDCVSI